MRNDLKPIGNRMGYERVYPHEGEYSITHRHRHQRLYRLSLSCWFNEEKEKADEPRMLGLLGKLNAHIAELNDGSFVVNDQETLRVEAL